jgi:4-alpha-glucanotransferase
MLPGMHAFDPSERYAGLLAPVFALRHADDLGVGDTRAVCEAIAFCAESNFAVLQLLPIHETVGDHSPYNPISSRALSPAYLYLHPDHVPGLGDGMVEQAVTAEWQRELQTGPVKQASVHALKLQLLLWAYRHFKRDFDAQSAEAQEFTAFQRSQEEWLPAYTLYRVLVREYEGNSNWSEWRPEHRTVEGAERWLERHIERDRLDSFREALAYVQWVAWRQWRAVRAYAEKLGVYLMGEVSFGVSKCSADVWANPALFDLQWNMGTRPIVYFDTNKDSERWGQNWGLPAYRWDQHKLSGFRWLQGRIAGEAQFFHLCRLDHLRGYFRGYMFPWEGGAKHAEFSLLTDAEVLRRTGGKMPRFVPGPDDDPQAADENEKQGRELLTAMQGAARGMFLVGEIMANMPEYMRRVLDDLGIASLTFPHLERHADGTLVKSEEYRRLSLAAYANHDHAPLAATYPHLTRQVGGGDADAERKLSQFLQLAGWDAPAPREMSDDLLAGLHKYLFATPCVLAVLMTSDLLGTAQRFNLPGSYGAGTWSERLELSLRDCVLHPVFGRRITRAAELIRSSGRRPPHSEPAAPVERRWGPASSWAFAQNA